MCADVVDIKGKPVKTKSLIGEVCLLDERIAQRLALDALDGATRDSLIPGFRLRKQGKAVAWVFGYTMKGKRGQLITIGPAVASRMGGRVVPAAEARAAAEGYRRQIAADIDPIEFRSRKRAGVDAEIAREKELRGFTFEKAVQRKIDRDRIRDSSVLNYRNLFNQSMKDIADSRMDRIGKAQWQRRLRDLADGKAPQTKDMEPSKALDYAGRVRMLVSALYNVASDEVGLPNPMPSLSREFPMPKHVRQGGIPRQQMSAWWNRVGASFNAQQQRLLLLYLLTGMRDAEARKLQWSEVKADRILLSAARHKTGSKSKAERIVPITAAIRTLLDGQQGKHSKWVFPAFKKDTKTGYQSSLQSLLAKMSDSDTKMFLHATRKMFLTELDALGDCPNAVRLALGGHIAQGVAERNYLQAHFADCVHHLERLQARMDEFLDGSTENELRKRAAERLYWSGRGFPPEVLAMNRDQLRRAAKVKPVWDRIGKQET